MKKFSNLFNCTWKIYIIAINLDIIIVDSLILSSEKSQLLIYVSDIILFKNWSIPIEFLISKKIYKEVLGNKRLIIIQIKWLNKLIRKLLTKSVGHY
jgi:hypothetical protein